MKWLFAILVALNIVVFGCMVAGKLVHGFSATPTVAASSEAQIATPAPATPGISVRDNTPVAASAQSIGNISTPKTTENKVEPSTNTGTKAKTNTSDAKDTAAATPATATTTCTATVVLPEDDFHRIKGLLTHWPYTTSRFIEQVKASAKPRTTTTATRYMVALSSADASIRSRLQEQGFDYGINQGKVSLGVFNRREDAETLMARAKMQGFSDATVTTLDSSSESTTNASTSIAKMRIVFSGVDDSAIKDINNITSRYGQIQRSGKCR